MALLKELSTPKPYTAIFTSRTGPGMAHVLSVANHQIAWSTVAAKFLDQGQLVALIPGHHPLIMSGATLHKVPNKETPCFSLG